MVPDLLVVDDLVVRTYRRSDALALGEAVAVSLEHLRPWMPWIVHEPVGIPQREAWIHECAEQRAIGGDTTYGIFDGERVVGGTGLHHRAGPDVLEIGYWVRVDETGRSIATRIAAALTETGLAEPGVEAVEIRHDRRNVASGRIPRRLGYELVEEARRPPVAPGECGVLLRWRTTARRWADAAESRGFPRSPAG